MKVLILAESCNPGWESVPLVGWSHYHALSQIADTHLVTRSWNRENLVGAGLVEGQDFTCIDTEALFDPVAKFVTWASGPNKGYAMLTALALPSYLWLEHLAWRIFGPAIRAGTYDLVHRITPVSPATPSLMAARCARAGVPFVLGPINGGLPWPPEFPGLRRREREPLSRLRGAYRYVPGYRSMRDSAAAIVVGSRGAMADLEPRWRDKAVLLPENGIEPDRFPAPAFRPPESYGRPLRCVFLGRLVPFKGADMVIDAAAPFLRTGDMTLGIIGFGPEEEALKAQAAALGVTVTFHGKIPHPAIAPLLAQADFMAFPSLREFGGGVVLEAMACGVVPVVLDYGGPAELITPETGFLLKLGPRADIVAGLHTRFAALVADPAALSPMAAAGIARVRDHFTWPAKAAQMMEVYRWALGQRADKPAFMG